MEESFNYSSFVDNKITLVIFTDTHTHIQKVIWCKNRFKTLVLKISIIQNKI